MATLLKENPLFIQQPNALKLAVYNDDIEVGNPLGSKTGINKLTMYYFTITNSPNSSSLSAIHLAMIAYSSDVKQYGHAHILRPLVEDIKKLEVGVDVIIDGEPQKVYGSVVSLPADNLAANETLGFVGSFSANYFCRFCKMSQAKTKTAIRQDNSVLRTCEDHKRDLEEIRKNPSSFSNHGVKAPCAFDELQYFNSVTSFTPDCMHDIFEGVAKRELSLILTDFILTSQYLSLEELNNIVKSFNYG